jgi:hypothetical protein
VGIYAGYYNLVTERWMATSPIKVSVAIVGRTAEQALAGVTMPPNIQGEVSEEASANETATGEVASPSFFQRFPFLDPLLKEPLTQTAIGLDFAKASLLGKIWRVLQSRVGNHKNMGDYPAVYVSIVRIGCWRNREAGGWIEAKEV